MSDPAADYGAKVMAKGFEVSGDVLRGFRATVPYLLTWDNAYGFCNTILSSISTHRVGPITFTGPYIFPGGNVPIYAQRFRVVPCGADGTTINPTQGLRAGEFFTHAIVTVEFEQVPWAFDALTEDPNGLNQLDPSNPITFCEQSVKIGGKMTTRKGLAYAYDDDNKPVAGDVGVLEVEAKLVLKFPRVPYLPWQLLVPYVGKANKTAILSCAAETLVLEAPNTDAKVSINSPTPIEQAVTLEFAYDPLGWNTAPKPDGSRVHVHQKGDASKSIYDLVDFGEIFTSLEFSETPL